MTSNGAEQRFWVYFDSTNQFRAMDNWITAAADRPFYIQFANDGNIYVYTDRTGNPNGYTTAGHTRVGSYATGWTEVRIINTFSGTGPQSYTLSVRRNATDLWTPLKASGATGFNIPFRGTNNITKTGGLLFGAYQNANMWIDDLRYSPTSQFSIRATAGAGGSISPSGTQTLPYGTDSGSYTITPGPGKVVADVLVDGVSVGAVTSYTFTDLRTDHTIAATFQVPDMPITPIDCAACHAGDDHGEGPDCGDCHWISDGHPGTPSDMHIPADVTGCTPCHDESLTIEHNGRTPDAGGTFVCNTCHASSDPAVSGAIAANNSACSACHDTAAGHSAVHNGGLAGQNACAECHDDNISTQHGGECTTCHESANPAVQAAISSNRTACSACHPGGHNAGSPAIQGDRYGLPTSSVNATSGYVYWAAATRIASLDAAQAVGGPHGNYTTTTIKCAVCHSVHGADAAGTLLLNGTSVGNSCNYCHFAGSTVTPVQVALSAEGVNNSPHSTCLGYCHTNSPHGVGASEYLSIKAKLLEDAADTRIGGAIANSATTGFTAAVMNGTVDHDGVALGTGMICSRNGCHNNAGSAFAIADSNKDIQLQDAAASIKSGHPVIGALSADWGATHDGVQNPTAVAYSSVAAGCQSCHDYVDHDHQRPGVPAQPLRHPHLDDRRLPTPAPLTTPILRPTNVIDGVTSTVPGLLPDLDRRCLPQVPRRCWWSVGVGKTF